MSAGVPPADDTGGDFGLRDAIGDDLLVRLMRSQRDIARKHGETPAVKRATEWLVANGFEEASDG